MSVWQIKQLGKLRETDPRMVDEAVDQLLTQEVELREKLVIGAYLDEDINLGKAAELLGVHRVELRRRFMNQGIPVVNLAPRSKVSRGFQELANKITDTQKAWKKKADDKEKGSEEILQGVSN